jgi:hypothetical protein
LVIFNEKDGRYGGKSICLKGQVIVSPFLKLVFENWAGRVQKIVSVEKIKKALQFQNEVPFFKQ